MRERDSQFKLKKDTYRSARGGEAHLLKISCSKCSSQIIMYQKDGKGDLIRCYLNRILSPPTLENLQYEFQPGNIKDLPNLTCDCGNVLGTPMLYKDGRVAYRLIRGSFTKRRIF